MDKERELAIKILNEFEELLEEKNITIPDEDRTGNEDEARIFGATYWDLEDKITEMLKEAKLK